MNEYLVINSRAKGVEIRTEFSGKKYVEFKDANGKDHKLTFATSTPDKDRFQNWISVGSDQKNKFFFNKNEFESLSPEMQQYIRTVFEESLRRAEEFNLPANEIQEAFSKDVSDKINALFAQRLPELIAGTILAHNKSLTLTSELKFNLASIGQFKATTEGYQFKRVEYLGSGAEKEIHKVTKLIFSKTGLFQRKEVSARGQYHYGVPEKLRSEGALLSQLKGKVRHLLLCFTVKHKKKETTGFLMQYCNGGDASKYCYKAQDTQTFTEKESPSTFLRIFQHAAEAVADLHKLYYCHGDIKPWNILVNRDSSTNEVEGVLSDLGGTVKSGKRLVRPTLAYLDMETRRKKISFFKRATTKNDVWALGLTLFQFAKGISTLDGLCEIEPFSYEKWYNVYNQLFSKLDLNDPIDQIIAMCLQPAQHRPSAEFVAQQASRVLSNKQAVQELKIHKYHPPAPNHFERLFLFLQNLAHTAFKKFR